MFYACLSYSSLKQEIAEHVRGISDVEDVCLSIKLSHTEYHKIPIYVSVVLIRIKLQDRKIVYILNWLPHSMLVVYMFL